MQATDGRKAGTFWSPDDDEFYSIPGDDCDVCFSDCEQHNETVQLWPGYD